MPILFAELFFESETLRLCSANRTISWNGYDWLGAGPLGNISKPSESLETKSNSLTLSLSGVPTDMVSLALGEVYKGRKGNIYAGCLKVSENIYQSDDADAYIADLISKGATLSDEDKLHISRHIKEVIDLGIWENLVGYWLVLGGTAATHAINAKSPGTYDLQLYGTITHDQYGMKSDGSTGYANTGVNPSDISALSDQTLSLGFYCNEGSLTSSEQIDMGCVDEYYNLLQLNEVLSLSYTWRNYGAFTTISDGVSGATSDDTEGFLVSTQGGATDAELYKGGDQIDSSSSSFGATPPNLSLYLMALNWRGGYVQSFSQRRIAMAFVSAAPIPSESQSAFYESVQALQTYFNRNVGGKIIRSVDQPLEVVGAFKLFGGVMDIMGIEEGKETSTVSITIESKLSRQLNVNETRYTDRDQQRLFPGDKGMEYVAGLQNKETEWGTTS